MLALTVLAGVSLLGWLYLLAGHGGFWRTDQPLPAMVTDPPAPWPSVLVVVPARDEASVLPTTLPSLLAQDYPGALRVVVVDDGSSDGTAGVVRNLGVSVLDAGPRPPGWVGKVWAMSCGLDGASEDFVLFTDADIAHAPGSLRALVRAAVAGEYGLVSQMALLNCTSAAERLVVPAFVYFFALLYPFRWVNRARSRVAAAAGGCMLVRRSALVAAGGMGSLRDALIDDVALGRLLKGSGVRVWLGLSRDVVSVRRYPRLSDLWEMVARSAFHQLRYSYLLLAGTVLGLGLLFVVPPMCLVLGLVFGLLGFPFAWWAFGLGLAAWLLLAVSELPMLRWYRLAWWRALVLPGVACLYLAMTLDSARRHRRGVGGSWKGRTHPQ